MHSREKSSSRPRYRSQIKVLAVLFMTISVCASCVPTYASALERKVKDKVIIDTDIGTDIDDAFAVALALRCPELEILGFTTTTGDTAARARIIDRMLNEIEQQAIPVAVGTQGMLDNTLTAFGEGLSQRRYGEGGKYHKASHPQAVDFILEQIRRYPEQITLVAIGPLTNIGALIDKNAAEFRKLKRVIIMGGSIKRGYLDLEYAPIRGASPEVNIAFDVPAAQKLFQSGVPLYVMPLDSTVNLKFDEIKRNVLFGQDTPITNALSVLYFQWAQWGGVTPTLFDPMTLAYLVEPKLCPVMPMRLRVDESGFTRSETGDPNAQVCLHSEPDAFFRFYLTRLIGSDQGVGGNMPSVTQSHPAAHVSARTAQ